MTTKQFETWLAEAIEAQRMDADDDLISRVEGYEERGIMTTDRGLVVHFEDGSEIQLTLVQSGRARNERGHDTMSGEPTGDDEDDDGSWEAAARLNGIG